MYNFLSSVSPQQNLRRQTSVLAWLQLSLNGGQCYSSVTTQFKRQTSVIARFYLSGKGNTSSRCEGGLTQKKNRAHFGSSFYMFFLLPLSLPSVNWASQEGCFFSPEVLTPVLHLFYFHGIFLSLSFSHHYFGLLFPILTT